MKPGSFLDSLIFWNRKLHIYIGLFLVLFIWLFSFSGLLLNHGKWKFAEFWQQRKESEIVTPLEIPVIPDSSSMILSFMHQMNISGEISNVRLTSDSVDFRVSIPGKIRNIHVDFNNKLGRQKLIEFNFWGKLRTLHTFNGMDRNNQGIKPNWILTKIWVLSMDGIAIGLALLCISSWIMWYRVRKNYVMGLYVLALGFAFALYFVYLVRLM